MSEWKELEMYNLPFNILKDGYEFEHYMEGNWQISPLRAYEILTNMAGFNAKYHYRKPEPKQPSHYEIWNNVWKMSAIV